MVVFVWIVLNYYKHVCSHVSDECEEHTDGCSDVCVNTEGSFYCECFAGSILQADNKTCLHDSATGTP